MVAEDDYKSAPPGRDGMDKADKGGPIGLSSLGRPRTPDVKAGGVIGQIGQRMKRFAISAEPSKKVTNVKDMVINKIDKSEK